MVTSRIEFSANFKTNFGENLYICGNIPDLGNWNPEKSLKMHTDSHLYPVWNSNKTISVRYVRLYPENRQEYSLKLAY